MFGRIVIGLAVYILALRAPLVAETSLETTTCVVMNATTGRMLLQHGAHKKMYPASTTKVALLAYVLSSANIDLNQKIVVPLEAVKAVSDIEKSRANFSRFPSHILEHNASIAGFKAGEIILLKDALFGAMLPSGNDAANVLAYYWGNGSIETCVEDINRFADTLGCFNTKFLNPSGLHHPEHVSTAYDLALLTRYGLRIPLFRQIVRTTSYTKEKTNKQPVVTWTQTNKLLLEGPYYYDLAIGVKTGFHSRAQHCLIAVGESEDRSVIVVLLHCQDRKQMFLCAKKLLQRFLSEKKVDRIVVEKGSLRLTHDIEGQNVPLSIASLRKVAVAVYPSEEPKITATVEWKELTFPIEPGHDVGIIRIFVDDQEVDHALLLSTEHRDMTWRQRFLVTQKFLKDHRGFMMGVLLIGGLILGLFIANSRKR